MSTGYITGKVAGMNEAKMNVDNVQLPRWRKDKNSLVQPLKSVK